jgi:hypothetical protein
MDDNGATAPHKSADPVQVDEIGVTRPAGTTPAGSDLDGGDHPRFDQARDAVSVISVPVSA